MESQQLSNKCYHPTKSSFNNVFLLSDKDAVKLVPL